MVPKVAVIDDEPKIREMLRALLEGEGYEVVEAADGLEGFRLVERERPALVVTDLLLPRLSGFKLCQRIKETPALAGVPVVLLTGVYRKERYKTEGLQYGADAYLTKPVAPEELKAAVKRLCPLPAPAPAAAPEGFAAKMEALKRGFADGIPGRLAEISRLWEEALREGADPAVRSHLHRQVHSLAGAAGTFGFPALSAAARSLEYLLGDWAESGEPPGPELLDGVQRGLEALQREAGGSLAPAEEEVEMEVPAAFEAPTVEPAEGSRLVFVVDDDEKLAQDLARQIGRFGYETEVFPGPAPMEEALRRARPVALLMDILFAGQEETGTEAVSRLFPPGQPRPHVIFFSQSADFRTRLRAVRAGGEAFFPKPVEASDLVAVLDHLTRPRPRDPYRILVVDDEEEMARRTAAILEEAGMATRTVTEPAEVLEVLSEFKPELILMDLYMPGCNGLELAAVIRQIPAHLTVPIVFLSMESRIQHQMAAIDLGADDFLTKSIAPRFLLSSVAARAQRARLLTSFLVRDGLTGLLNHTRLKEQLQLEVSRAQRTGSPLSFAMLDIDRFKEVNDGFGHPTGDRVLRSLAFLLKQRLRRTDLLGRYGGDEFAVVFPDTRWEDAARKLEEIRKDFGEVPHPSPAGPFRVTLSAGVAELGPEGDAASLSAAADRALYAAKERGRNRVEAAPEP
ncbi:MAG: response regulator [Acidobacteriota bacterium]